MAKQGLIIVDIQNDYFPGGKWEQHRMEEASAKAAELLAAYRERGLPVLHVQHVMQSADAPFFAAGTQGAEIHPSVAPTEAEQVFVKNTINPFISTSLLDALKEQGIEEVLVIGAMSHMCIDATVRAAADLGFSVTVAQDACASRDLVFGEKTIAAPDVHAAYMSALGIAYANIQDTSDVLQSLI